MVPAGAALPEDVAADSAAEDVKEAKEAVTDAADAAVDEAKEAVNAAAKEVSAVAAALKEDTLKEESADADKKGE